MTTKVFTRGVLPVQFFGKNMQASAKTVQTGELFDVRGVQPPENVLSILKRASELPAGAALEIRTDNNPWQLYDLLQQRGYFLQMERQKDGSFLGKLQQRELGVLKH